MEKRYVGNENQLLTARRVTYEEGLSRGIHAIELRNTDGLYATCIEDQCLNLYDFSYKGINFAFQQKNGLVSGRYFNPAAPDFEFYWPAGMLYTCGLTNVGPGGIMEDGKFYPDHGRMGMLPAQNVSLRRTEEGAEIEGSIHEGMLAGYHMELKRKITFPAKGKCIRIEDEISNHEPFDTEFAFLYHINLGYPLLSEHSRVIKGKGGGYSIHTGGEIPRDWAQCRAPEDHKDEDLFCHENAADKDGWAYTALLNEKLEIGCYIKYKTENLPYLMHWRNMCSHDYALGLEPSNCQVLGRDRERRNGTLQVMPAYGKKTYTVEVGVLDGKAEIAAFEAMVNAL